MKTILESFYMTTPAEPIAAENLEEAYKHRYKSKDRKDLTFDEWVNEYHNDFNKAGDLFEINLNYRPRTGSKHKKFRLKLTSYEGITLEGDAPKKVMKEVKALLDSDNPFKGLEKCGWCDRDLTDADSIALGLGSTCRKRFFTPEKIKLLLKELI